MLSDRYDSCRLHLKIFLYLYKGWNAKGGRYIIHSRSVYVSWGLWNGLCNKLNESKMMCALKRPTNSDDWYSLIHFSFRLNIEGPFNVLADHLSRLPVNTSSTKPIRPHDSPSQFPHSHICKGDTLAVPLGHVFSPVFTVFLAMGLRLFGLVHPEYAISEHLLVTGSNNPLIISGFINLSQ